MPDMNRCRDVIMDPWRRVIGRTKTPKTTPVIQTGHIGIHIVDPEFNQNNTQSLSTR